MSNLQEVFIIVDEARDTFYTLSKGQVIRCLLDDINMVDGYNYYMFNFNDLVSVEDVRNMEDQQYCVLNHLDPKSKMFRKDYVLGYAETLESLKFLWILPMNKRVFIDKIK